MRLRLFKKAEILCRLTAMSLFACTGWGSLQHAAAANPIAVAQNPIDATYIIGDRSFNLDKGRVTLEVSPGAASKTLIEVTGEPVFGDLDRDGVSDAALVLVETTGGSGTFYHGVAAFNRDNRFIGTRSVLLGDRIVPLQLSIRHGIVIVDYLDRRSGEAMAAAPSQEVSKYLVARESQLEEIPLAANEVIAAGEVVIGHEVRQFTPCGAGDAAWLIGDSPAIPAMKASYHLNMSDASPYFPLFMVLTGHPVDRPAEGFGADYPAGFYATKLVHSLPGASCSP